MTTRRQSAPAAVRWTAYVGVAIVFAIACAFLSNWQLSKNSERTDQLQLIATNYDATPVALGDLLTPGQTLPAGDKWRPVTLTGTYLGDQQLLVRNRIHAGTAAYEMIVPLRTAEGRVFLVDRGWEPPGNRQPTPDVIPAAPSGTVEVVVRLLPGENLPSAGKNAPAGQVPSINLPLIAQKIGGADGAALDRGAYGQLVSENPAPATAPRGFDAPSADPGPFLSYGIQWILFAVMGFVFIWYVIRSERRIRREDREDAAEIEALAATDPEAAARLAAERVAERTHSRTKLRADRDSEDEDALLDHAER
ncbi:SURF1 family cytochrome oxidase biogenesis protein [Microbacterium terrisoli]|jgi:cytochrome oxidase assembly protein ShyY1|uniref:SURF1 family cytochrome oxidase biogenesis protein n=1 Tax=Microbacterium terrisoli TaxID=3242192 RepID=UPI002806459A|nr:SURF1 family protein [Microbacterium protaetiae]